MGRSRPARAVLHGPRGGFGDDALEVLGPEREGRAAAGDAVPLRVLVVRLDVRREAVQVGPRLEAADDNAVPDELVEAEVGRADRDGAARRDGPLRAGGLAHVVVVVVALRRAMHERDVVVARDLGEGRQVAVGRGLLGGGRRRRQAVDDRDVVVVAGADRRRERRRDRAAVARAAHEALAVGPAMERRARHGGDEEARPAEDDGRAEDRQPRELVVLQPDESLRRAKRRERHCEQRLLDGDVLERRGQHDVRLDEDEEDGRGPERPPRGVLVHGLVLLQRDAAHGRSSERRCGRREALVAFLRRGRPQKRPRSVRRRRPRGSGFGSQRVQLVSQSHRLARRQLLLEQIVERRLGERRAVRKLGRALLGALELLEDERRQHDVDEVDLQRHDDAEHERRLEAKVDEERERAAPADVRGERQQIRDGRGDAERRKHQRDPKRPPRGLLVHAHRRRVVEGISHHADGIPDEDPRVDRAVRPSQSREPHLHGQPQRPQLVARRVVVVIIIQ
mmetsp:Transcript_8588/g.35405  ORF Transcript_8588/g.35405 Transcript_8588/m.35405 type:complete len:508 (-) Transcript_8588:668-2191(-)